MSTKEAEVIDAQGVSAQLEQLARFLSGDGDRVTLSYGQRRFDVFLNEQGELAVHDMQTHKRSTTLPKLSRDEDALVLNPLREGFSTQKRQLQVQKRALVKRIEEMCRWHEYLSLSQWRELFSSSPLHEVVASGVVWGVYAPSEEVELLKTFQRDRQGVCLDVAFEVVELPEAGRIKPVHPMELESEQLGAWATYFAELERVQPFEQLGRAVVPPEKWEQERAWHQQVFWNKENISIRLRKFDKWYADYYRRRANEKKNWFAGMNLASFDVSALFIVLPMSSVIADPGRHVGLNLKRRKATFPIEELVPWEALPASLISELLLDLREVAEMVHIPPPA